MVTKEEKEEIERLINVRLNNVLLIAESSLHPNQFQAFRKLTLNSFGKSGLGKDLENLFKQKERFGKGRNTLGKRRGV